MGRLVSRIVAVFKIYQPHVKRHLVRVVGGDQHLCLFFRLGQRFPVYVVCIPGFSELYQFLNENLLLGSGRYVIELLVEFRPVNPYVLGRLVGAPALKLVGRVGEVLTGNGGIIVQVIAVETESTDGGTEIGDKGIEMVGNIAYQKFFLYPVGSPAGPRLTAGDLHPYHGMAGSASLYITVGITVDDAPAHFSGNPLYIG